MLEPKASSSRLLPSDHIRTSPSQALVVGIIDYMRQYDIIKKMERMGKSVGMIAGQAEPTVIQPQPYRARFLGAMEKYFAGIPDKWTP